MKDKKVYYILLVVLIAFLALAWASSYFRKSPSHFMSTNGQYWSEKPSEEIKVSKSNTLDLQKLNSAFIELAEGLTPSVVNIYTTTKIEKPGERNLFWGPQGDLFKYFFGDPFSDELFLPFPSESTSLGSGFILNDKGVIVTNSHVVRAIGQTADEIMVKFTDQRGEQFPAEVIGFDESTDIAVLKLKKKPKKLTAVHLGDSEALRVGEWVLAIGNPYGHSSTVTQGIVSALGRDLHNLANLSDFIQTSASINPGNSGGPLFNLKGEVIGVNTAIDPRAHGIGFAIPIGLAKPVIKQLIESGEVTRGWIGVGITDLTPELKDLINVPIDRGVVVQSVEKGKPADRAGIKVYDVIVKVNDTEVASAKRLANALGESQPNEKVEIQFYRGMGKKVVTVKVGKRPSGDKMARAFDKKTIEPEKIKLEVGFTLSNLSDRSKKEYGLSPKVRGVLVASVERFSLARRAGFSAGDVIVEINRKEVSSVAEVTRLLNQSIEEKSRLLFRVIKKNGWSALIVLDTSLNK